MMPFVKSVNVLVVAAILTWVAGRGGVAQAVTPITVPDGSFEQVAVREGMTDGASCPNLSIIMNGYTVEGSNFNVKNTAGSVGISGPAAQDGSNYLSMWPGDTPYHDNNNNVSTSG